MTDPAEEPDVTTHEPDVTVAESDVTVAEPEVATDESEPKVNHHHAVSKPRSVALPIAICAAVIGLAALGLSIWGLVRHPHETATSSLSPADAKTKACTAFGTVARAVSLQTNAQLGDDPTARAAVAANARLATLGGGQYLMAALDPSTPNNIADPARSFASALTDIGMSQLAGAANDNPDQVARLKTAEGNIVTLTGLCK
ncbi:hypothetical protein [Mycobacterium sp. OTB74]|uniref:hypothetical protein n=1 Tax=Mycobacterium sp. OTB74 TaxID=1853452 RepID=UPI002474448B|nr:hypothetical protein [Mycobacterium sp. OTB74]MDH6247062.1 hypothetical protein [Mycobacterium sp. OTB74]